MQDVNAERLAKGIQFKVVLSGDVVEIFQYSKCIPVDFRVDRIDYAKEKEGKKRKDNIYRARANIRRIVWANLTQYTKFLTLTYVENMTDYDQFKHDFEEFVRRMKRRAVKLRYLYILEKQRRGAIHAHVVVFNEEFIPFETIRDAWGKGNIDIHVLEDVRNAGAYICKYLGKETFESFSDLNYRSYRCSLGLKRPVELTMTSGQGRYIWMLQRDSPNLIYQDCYTLDVPRTNFLKDHIEVMYSQYQATGLHREMIERFKEIKEAGPDDGIGSSESDIGKASVAGEYRDDSSVASVCGRGRSRRVVDNTQIAICGYQ